MARRDANAATCLSVEQRQSAAIPTRYYFPFGTRNLAAANGAMTGMAKLFFCSRSGGDSMTLRTLGMTSPPFQLTYTNL